MPHLCGIPKPERLSRRLCMFRVFIDESGNDASEPMLMAVAWVGSVEQWKRFADEWQLTLEANNPKPLVLHKNERYFKHSEARGREGCFAGFSDDEAELKTVNLASVITRYDLKAFGLILDREQYFRIVDEMVVKKSGTLYRNYIKDPLYILLHRLVDWVLHNQYESNPNDKVDFIFDSGKMSERVVAMFEFIRDNFSHLSPPIMGTLIPMDDKKVMPLQAADLFAGQIRMALQTNGRIFSPLVVLKQMKWYWVENLDEGSIRGFLTITNISSSLRRLSQIKKERDREKKE